MTIQMKKILLFAPNMGRDSAATKWLSPCLGIYRIAGYLNRNGHRAECFDTALTPADQRESAIRAKLAEQQFDIIGFSVLEESLIHDIGCMNLVKSVCPDAVLVAGGIEAQYSYQEILDKSPCKLCILGEGEEPMLAIADGAPFNEIPGIVFKNPAVPLSVDKFREVTEAIPYETMPYEAYWDYYKAMYGGELTEKEDRNIHTVRIFTRNYCPMGCKFCCSTNQLADASERKAVKPADVVGDALIGIILRIIKSHPRVKTLYFTDDNFCLDLRKVRDFCEKIIALNLEVSFICFSRLDNLDERTIVLMKQAGFRLVNMGLESFSEPLLKKYGKKLNYQKAMDNIALLKIHGITPFMSVILCGPDATLEDVSMTVDGMIAQLEDGLAEAGVNVAVQPFKGSYYFDHCNDIESEIVAIPGTDKTIKKNYFIRAADPEVRELQYRFLETYHDEVKMKREMDRTGHMTSSSQAMVKLRLLKKLIEDLVAERADGEKVKEINGKVKDARRGIDAIHKLEIFRSGSVL